MGNRYIPCTQLPLVLCKSSNYKVARKKNILLDPYIQSFWGKNIELLLHDNPLGGFDTIFFDREGNISEIHSLGRLSEKNALPQWTCNDTISN